MSKLHIGEPLAVEPKERELGLLGFNYRGQKSRRGSEKRPYIEGGT